MPTTFTHAVAAAALARVAAPPVGRRRWLLVAAGCAVLPDADVLGFPLGLGYDPLLGHRGVTHSIAFALALATLVVAVMPSARRAPHRVRIVALLFVATVSHGVLDALTNGGFGVAFFAPFSAARFHFPWRPIVVSPLAIRPFLTSRGFAVLASEVLVVWLPAAVLVLAAVLVEGRRGLSQTTGGSGSIDS